MSIASVCIERRSYILRCHRAIVRGLPADLVRQGGEEANAGTSYLMRSVLGLPNAAARPEPVTCGASGRAEPDR